MDRCSPASCTGGAAGDGDLDGDGEPPIECGGSDCDDTDGNRYPGLAEVCDGADPAHDEDCDPTTVGTLDLDGDGETDSRCCNGDTCGTDCDDSRPDVRSLATEICDGVDNDCDGDVDEALPFVRCYRDEDGDGYGVTEEFEMRCACAEGWSPLPGDCFDSATSSSAPSAHPGADWRGGGYCTSSSPCVGTNGDWNCDGIEERRHLQTWLFCPSPGCTPHMAWVDEVPPCAVRAWADRCNEDCTVERVQVGQECR